MTAGDYFVATVLPTFLAVLFLIPFKMIYLHTTSLGPFQRLTGTRVQGLSIQEATNVPTAPGDFELQNSPILPLQV
jgi:hypothetical protein